MELYGKGRQRAERMIIFYCRLWGDPFLLSSVWFYCALLCSFLFDITVNVTKCCNSSTFCFSQENFSPGINSQRPLQHNSCQARPGRTAATLLEGQSSNSSTPATSVLWDTHTHTHSHVDRSTHWYTSVHKHIEKHTLSHMHGYTLSYTHSPSVFVSLPLPSPWVCLQNNVWCFAQYACFVHSYCAFSVEQEQHACRFFPCITNILKHKWSSSNARGCMECDPRDVNWRGARCMWRKSRNYWKSGSASLCTVTSTGPGIKMLSAGCNWLEEGL